MALTARQISDFKARLEQEKTELADASAGTADTRAPVELDQQSVGRLSRIDAMQVQAMAKAQEGRRRLRERMIDAALARVAQDEYGYCTICGEDIPEKRLDIDPAAATCVTCLS